jgi:hypothetical protein
MIVFKILGTYRDGEETMDFGLWLTRKRAEQRKQNEIDAYTYKGVCDWEFDIVEVEIQE